LVRELYHSEKNLENEFVYIIREAGMEESNVLYATLNKKKRDIVFNRLKPHLDNYPGFAIEDVPLEKFRTYAFDDWGDLEEKLRSLG